MEVIDHDHDGIYKHLRGNGTLSNCGWFDIRTLSTCIRLAMQQ